MNNPLQEQLLKAGLVNKKQVKKANQEKTRHQKKNRHNKNVIDETGIRAQQAIDDKVRRDRELNKKKEQQARNKAISAEIDQLILNNLIKRDESCEIPYNFEHRKKITRIYLNDEMKQQLTSEKIAIARIDGRYELIPVSIAEKIRQRNEKRIVQQTIDKPDHNDEYAEYEVPDDLIW